MDAVCVNQEATKEREHQVALMTWIYSEASRNIIYLGEGDPASLKGLETIRALSAELDRSNPTHANGLETPIEKSALSAFFLLPWFSRVWVVQEAVLARKNVCILGRTSIDFDDVTKVTTRLFRLSILSLEEQRSTPEDWDGLGRMLDCMATMPDRLTAGLSDDAVRADGGDPEIADVLYFKALVQACLNRQFVLTDWGDLGLAPRTSRVGDTIAGLLVDHGGAPYALHYRESDDSFELLGAYYVNGHMSGALEEAIRGCESDINYEWIKIT